MKYILIIAILIMGCSENSTSPLQSEYQGKAFCSTEEWSNGEPKEMFIIWVDTEIDSANGDTLFITQDGAKWAIVENQKGVVDELLVHSGMHDYYRDTRNEYFPLYYNGQDIKRCIE
jgi:hypothetical protein